MAFQGAVISEKPSTDSRLLFYEIDGISSTEAEHAGYIHSWKKAQR